MLRTSLLLALAALIFPACNCGTSQTPDAGLSVVGCVSGERAGFFDAGAFPDVAACPGTWVGGISNADALCEPGWHVCLGSEPALHAVTFTEAREFAGCFPFNAAQDSFECIPGCLAAVDAGVDTAARIDLAGVGAGCAFAFETGASCLAVGRIDAAENSGTGCNWTEGYSGVVCCRD